MSGSHPPVAYDGSRILDISRDRYFQLMQAEKDLRALRLALREPSDELVSRLANVHLTHLPQGAWQPGYCRCGELNDGLAHRVRMVLAALAGAVTPDGR